MSKLREFVDQVEARKDNIISSVIIDRDLAVAAQDFIKGFLTRASNGGKKAAAARVVNDSPKAAGQRRRQRAYRERLAKRMKHHP